MLSSRIALPPDHPTLVSVVAFIAKVMRALAPPQSELAETMFQFVDDTIVEVGVRACACLPQARSVAPRCADDLTDT